MEKKWTEMKILKKSTEHLPTGYAGLEHSTSTLAKPGKAWRLKDIGPNSHEIRILDGSRSAYWHQRILVLSDIHFDNPHCKRKLFFKHLDEAAAENAPIFINGDFFCMMQGRYDPRKKKGEIREQHNNENYIDSVIEEAADLLEPYYENLTILGRGNHEQTILKHLELDPLHRLASIINGRIKTNHRVCVGGYGGWFVVRFLEDGHSFGSSNIKYFHGAGGNSPVTRGVIQTNRNAVKYSNADAVITGHIHQKWAVVVPREVLLSSGRSFTKQQLHVCTGTYKDEYRDGHSGFAVEKGFGPTALGGYWLDFTWQDEPGRATIRIRASEA